MKRRTKKLKRALKICWQVAIKVGEVAPFLTLLWSMW
jgi:hypothetical protein